MAAQKLDVVGLMEIGEMLGVSKQRAAQLSKRDDFPQPAAVISAGRIWRRRDVEAWARRAGRRA